MTRQIVTRVILLLVAAGSLYLLLPQVLDVFSSWPQLRGIKPAWLGLAVFFEAMAFVALWTLQRIAVGTRSWFAVGTSQLAANAAGSIIPGGGAASGAVQYGMLVRAGVPGERVASGLTASAAATTAAVFALPVVALLAGIGDAAAPEGLRKVAYIGAIAFALLGLAIIAALAWDAPLLALGRGARAAAGWVGKRERLEDLPARLLIQRDGIRRAVAEHPFVAGLAALGKWGFDYLALLCVLQGLGVHAEPTLVLLAYAAAALLASDPAHARRARIRRGRSDRAVDPRGRRRGRRRGGDACVPARLVLAAAAGRSRRLLARPAPLRPGRAGAGHERRALVGRASAEICE